jgi:hypothetical protein
MWVSLGTHISLKSTDITGESFHNSYSLPFSFKRITLAAPEDGLEWLRMKAGEGLGNWASEVLQIQEFGIQTPQHFCSPPALPTSMNQYESPALPIGSTWPSMSLCCAFYPCLFYSCLSLHIFFFFGRIRDRASCFLDKCSTMWATTPLVLCLQLWSSCLCFLISWNYR